MIYTAVPLQLGGVMPVFGVLLALLGLAVVAVKRSNGARSETPCPQCSHSVGPSDIECSVCGHSLDRPLD